MAKRGMNWPALAGLGIGGYLLYKVFGAQMAGAPDQSNGSSGAPSPVNVINQPAPLYIPDVSTALQEILNKLSSQGVNNAQATNLLTANAVATGTGGAYVSTGPGTFGTIKDTSPVGVNFNTGKTNQAGQPLYGYASSSVTSITQGATGTNKATIMPTSNILATRTLSPSYSTTSPTARYTGGIGPSSVTFH